MTQNATPMVWQGHDMSGTTAHRPTNCQYGQMYFDTDIGQELFWNGTNWSAAGAIGSGAVGQTITLAMMHGRNVDGTVLDATGGSGKLKIASTIGTSLGLLGNAAQNNTKTDSSQWEFVLPPTYQAGTDLTITINAQHIEAAGTTLTNTVVPLLYLLAKDGTSGSNLVSTSAAAITGSAADYAFTASGTGLVPGERFVLEVTSVATEGGNTGTTKNQVNSIRIS